VTPTSRKNSNILGEERISVVGNGRAVAILPELFDWIWRFGLWRNDRSCRLSISPGYLYTPAPPDFAKEPFRPLADEFDVTGSSSTLASAPGLMREVIVFAESRDSHSCDFYS